MGPNEFPPGPPHGINSPNFLHGMRFRGPHHQNFPRNAVPLPPPPSSSSTSSQLKVAEESPAVEKVSIESLICKPGRKERPDRLVIIVRGLPGSGKTHLCKLIKEREVQEGGSAPRMLCLDDYFMVEVEKMVTVDELTGKKEKKMVMEFEFDPALESSYKTSFLKNFKKQIDDCFFSFIVVDATFDKKIYLDEFWGYAKSKGFQVYVAQMEADVSLCTKRNEHHYKHDDIMKIKKGWDETPRHYIHLDISYLLKEENNIEEVEMEDATTIVEKSKDGNDDDEDEDYDTLKGHKKSKWELDTSEQTLDKLDGLATKKEAHPMKLEEYLQVSDDYEMRCLKPGNKKRVRWADIEERKDQERMRRLGFVVGLTDWDRMNDDSGGYADRALNKTKYI
ncbi:hypothetical protein HELRODRAFT_115915 [Helobdella robusta]|uniref:YLP motif-containing protein 1 n=1 Tax=Helobdella robusta TaxID=6412 RepID=T1EGB7_HELRO|nr:hypothetical protein HELRODRAFT_115915 [Helobdella robusta]ESN92425.1 hypothetical protein HELRODRAFT_115915 [Helobdella robusta]